MNMRSKEVESNAFSCPIVDPNKHNVTYGNIQIKRFISKIDELDDGDTLINEFLSEKPRYILSLARTISNDSTTYITTITYREIIKIKNKDIPVGQSGQLYKPPTGGA